MLNNSFKSKRTKYESLNKNTDTYFQIGAAQSKKKDKHLDQTRKLYKNKFKTLVNYCMT